MRYVDSRTVPYLVFPGQFHQMMGTGTTGDLGYAINLENWKRSPFVIADIGPSDAELGEMSIALAAALGGTNPNPRTGAGVPTGKIVLIVFPKSGRTRRWPLGEDEIKMYADELLSGTDGEEALRACRDDL